MHIKNIHKTQPKILVAASRTVKSLAIELTTLLCAHVALSCRYRDISIEDGHHIQSL